MRYSIQAYNSQQDLDKLYNAHQVKVISQKDLIKFDKLIFNRKGSKF